MARTNRPHRVSGAALLLLISCASLSDEPARFAATYTGEFLSNRSGGLQRGNAYLDNLDVTLAIDTGRLWGWPSSELFLYGLYNNGEPFSETYVGDFQVVSNIETGVEALRLFEAWFRFEYAEHSDVLVGLFDLNSEFDVLESSLLFTGSAHGIGTDISQAGVNGPSIFPVTGLAIRVSHRLNDQWQLRGALLDGVPGDPQDPDDTTINLSSDEGALAIVEAEWATKASRILAGAWGYSAKFSEDPLDIGNAIPEQRRGNFGAYLRGETVVLDAEQRIAIFGRAGYAHGDFNVFDYFFSAGVNGRGLIPGRHDDELGLAFAWSETSGNVKDLAARAGDAVDSREIAFELTYRANVTDRVVLQPAVHYVINPGINPALGNAFVAGLRFQVGLIR